MHLWEAKNYPNIPWKSGTVLLDTLCSIRRGGVEKSLLKIQSCQQWSSYIFEFYHNRAIGYQQIFKKNFISLCNLKNDITNDNLASMSPRSKTLVKKGSEHPLKVSLIVCCLGNNIRITGEKKKIHILFTYLIHLDMKMIPRKKKLG